MTLSDVARVWQQAGVSVVPILANQTKRPAVRWAEYQVAAPTLNQVDEWWGNGKSYGLALICGSVSGNLEMTEIEGRACDGQSMTEIANHMDELGIGDLWDLLTGPDGYSEMSPSGGLHLLYRINGDEHKVPGNTKIASGADNLVLAETRGEGGYVIVAPSPGQCHPSGEAWVILQGEYGSLPVITWEERCKLHEALRRALDESASGLNEPHQLHFDEPSQTVPQLTDEPWRTQSPDTTTAALPAVRSSAAGLSPGDHFEAVTEWDEILVPHGWNPAGYRGTERLWTRPGKDPRHGVSATTGFKTDRDRFFNFSTSTGLPVEQSLTKFAVYAYLNHNGNFSAAAKELKRRGFGTSGDVPPLDSFSIGSPVATAADYIHNDNGNARHLADRVRGRYVFLAEEKEYLRWDGVCWVHDHRFQLAHEFAVMAQEMYDEARAAGDDAGVKWWRQSGNQSRIDAALKNLRTLPGFTVTTAELDKDRHLLNLTNGTYNLNSHELAQHDPDLLISRVMGTSYDPEATCPNFESFMERVLPDEDMRSYVQRALGYTMLGDADQRSLFLVCGPSGTGKSTLMATMELLFDRYGVSAPSGTLRARGVESSSPSNDLHTLRGKRFVSTSETNEHTAYNEDLIKRLTGRDQIQSRELYQKFTSWSPRCTIWLATNHPPRFSSDDDAIWRRAKIVPFHEVLLGDGEVRDYAHNVLAKELDGIFNWVLAGLKAYQEHGLREPTVVQDMVREVRLQSDPVTRFLEDKLSDGILVADPAQRMRTTELYVMYTDWARQTGERALGSRRFTNRILSSQQHLTNTRIGGNYFWQGLGRAAGVGVLGMIPAWSPDN